MFPDIAIVYVALQRTSQSFEVQLASSAAPLSIMAIVPLPTTFRIGPKKYDYDYLVTGISINERPVYWCARDRGDGTGLLYLFVSDDNVWTVVSGPVEAISELEIRGGAPAFKAATEGEGVRQPGKHLWHCYNDALRTWWPASPFQTSTL